MYNNEIHKNPKSHLGFLLKGNCLYKLNRQEEAIKSFDKALELMPNCVGAIYNKGFIEYNSKQYKEALKLFKEAISKIEPIDSNIKKYYYLYYSKGLCEYQLENYESALNSFIKSNELKENDYLILDNIGRCYDKLKDYVKAIEYFINSFLASKSKYYIALYNQAMSLIKIKNKKFEAKKLFDSIIEDYNSDFGPAYYGLGLYFVSLDEKLIALDYFDKATALAPDLLDAYLRKGNCYHRLKRYTESIDCFDFIISKEPGYLNGIAYFNKGNSLKEIQRLDDAIECYQNAIKYQKKKMGMFIII
jgi:tetratricopeptide (TPR) repeat protein